MNKTKPFEINKQLVMDAYLKVRANKGSAGIDEMSLKEFDKDYKNHLYKLWNQMSSGSYMPPAVRLVEIPKKNGGVRPLGIPTVTDRIAQTVVKELMQPELEQVFDEDSYGYRTGKSAIDAVTATRNRCWRHNFVIDLDIVGFFDNIPHQLMMHAVRKHVQSKWMLLYIERWLKAPLQKADGSVEAREKGTQQGGVISPLLANLYLHYSYDTWHRKHLPSMNFERYADDIVVHCYGLEHAVNVKRLIGERLAKCGLTMHPEKTRIVYCKDSNRKDSNRTKVTHPIVQFDFLGFTFKPRIAQHSGRKEAFTDFLPAISTKAMQFLRKKMLEWKTLQSTASTLKEVAAELNASLRGWINYYGKFYGTVLKKFFDAVNVRIVKWAKQKFSKLRKGRRKAFTWLRRMERILPDLFAHWTFNRTLNSG